jgi:Poly-gamma-glutamate hydrolase
MQISILRALQSFEQIKIVVIASQSRCDLGRPFFDLSAVRRDDADIATQPVEALSLVANSNIVIAVHGCRGEESVVYLGGRDKALNTSVDRSLRANGFVTATHHNPALQGLHASNICNPGRCGCGVQLEIPMRLRSAIATKQMVKFVVAIREAIEAVQSIAEHYPTRRQDA